MMHTPENPTPQETNLADDLLIHGQFDSEPTWLARRNLAADAVQAVVKTADFEPELPGGLSYSA